LEYIGAKEKRRRRLLECMIGNERRYDVIWSRKEPSLRREFPR